MSHRPFRDDWDSDHGFRPGLEKGNQAVRLVETQYLASYVYTQVRQVIFVTGLVSAKISRHPGASTAQKPQCPEILTDTVVWSVGLDNLVDPVRMPQ